VGIIGIGYVGLPLAMAFAEAGFSVLGFDVNSERVADLNRGKSHIPDVEDASLQLAIDGERFSATDDFDRLDEVDTISICVPTPLSKLRDPDISFVVAAAERVGDQLRSGQLVILESTTYPGTTRDILLTRLTERGLQLGDDYFVAFSPERVDPGNITFGITNTPKVVGGIDQISTDLARLLYAQIIERVVPVSSPEVAEMVKLLENTFRSVNIGLANEMAIMADRLGIDVWEVIEAASTKPFGFMPFYPGPGIGGHCIPLDPYYLSWKMKTVNYRARFIELAGEINGEMPHYVVNKVTFSLNQFSRSVRGSDILVLGVAYKPNIDDSRESPALDIIALLTRLGANVSYSDPYIESIVVESRQYRSVNLSAERLQEADCVLIATNHAVFDYEQVGKNARLIVDTRNALGSILAPNAVVVRL
jgi:UDP-N-acetyl-D-glucosamine dehydrogenase